jgi:hypothetical protein
MSTGGGPATKHQHVRCIFEMACRRLAKIILLVTGTPKENSYERSAEILSHSTGDLVRTMEAYVSRDRIARGMALNSLIGAFVSFALLTGPLKISVPVACLISFTISLLIWVRLRRLSSRFKRVALAKLNQHTGNAGAAQ